MAKILVGTCGFFYDDWIGPVYPRGLKEGTICPCMRKKFNTVELDYTYYGMPKPENLAKILVTGGLNLTFAAKATQTMTRIIDPDRLEGTGRTVPSSHRAGFTYFGRKMTIFNIVSIRFNFLIFS
jgi:uncharacterized protein YecE (DUF72 family)